MVTQRHTLDARGRALARVATAECFRRRIAINASLSEAARGPLTPRQMYSALVLEDLIAWRGGYCLTGHGKNALVLAGVQLPEGL